MSYANDQLENAMRRVHSTAEFNTTVDVYEPTSTYTAGDGYDVDYPNTPSATYDARSEEPSANADKDEGGTTVEIDRVIMVRDDTGQQWVGYGEAGDAPVRIRDTGDGIMYEVQSVTDEYDGRITLDVVEV